MSTSSKYKNRHMDMRQEGSMMVKRKLCEYRAGIIDKIIQHIFLCKGFFVGNLNSKKLLRLVVWSTVNYWQNRKNILNSRCLE